jgi:alpha-glucosidase
VHEIIRKMRQVIDDYPDRMMVGEIYLPVERLVTYYGSGGAAETHLPFNFQLIRLPWHARVIAETIARYEALLPPEGWPNWVLGNHDRPRIATRVGRDQARVAAMLLLTLRGTPTMYYGDELGMVDVPVPPEALQDPFERNVPGLGFGRDPERTPMQWTAGACAGFTTGRPWLPIARDFTTVNVELEKVDRRSMLSLYQRLIELRRAEPALAVGTYTPFDAGDDLLAYIRQHGERQLMIVLNLGSRMREWHRDTDAPKGKILLSTSLERQGEHVGTLLQLRPDEGAIVELTKAIDEE